MDLKRLFFAILIFVLSTANGVMALSHTPVSSMILDDEGYGISFGETIEVYQGETDFIIPIYITNEEPIEYIYLSLEYDASIIEPVLVGPSYFFQYFNYDISEEGYITIEAECDLITPPEIDPIPAGDTIFAYILCDVVVENLDQDVYTEIGFYEDGNTPFPDNFLMGSNGYFIVEPQLVLTTGLVYVFTPLYGDINLNSIPYEVGDVITFVSYLSGEIDFTARQYANSDCNLDGIPASISDLVYILNVINGGLDRVNVIRLIDADLESSKISSAIQLTTSHKILDNNYILNIYISGSEPLGGFLIALRSSDFIPFYGEVTLNGGYGDAQLMSLVSGDEIRVVCFAYEGSISPDTSICLSIPISTSNLIRQSDFSITFADFSDEYGVRNTSEVSYRMEITSEQPVGIAENDSLDSVISSLAYPNPFNSQVLISFTLPQPGMATVEVFDILGRKVRTLEQGYKESKLISSVWDGKSECGESVTAGIYFCRLKCAAGEQILKVQYLK